MDTRDTQNFSARKLSCPQMLMDCCHLSFLEMKAGKGMLGFRIRPDSICWLLCKLLGGHCWSVGSGVLQAEPFIAFLAQRPPCPSATPWDLALPCYPGWMEMLEVTLTSHYKALVWDTGNSGSSSRVQQQQQGAVASPAWRCLRCKTIPCTRLV